MGALEAFFLAVRAVRWNSNVDGVAPPLCNCCSIDWAPGLGAGNIEPPPPGVRPVLREDSFGVGNPRPNPSKISLEPAGPASIAGLSGPARSEFDQPSPPAVEVPGSDGDVSAATGGRRDLPGVSADGFPLKDCSKGLGSRESCADEL